jgi:hypothetical protein
MPEKTCTKEWVIKQILYIYCSSHKGYTTFSLHLVKENKLECLSSPSNIRLARDKQSSLSVVKTSKFTKICTRYQCYAIFSAKMGRLNKLECLSLPLNVRLARKSFMDKHSGLFSCKFNYNCKRYSSHTIFSSKIDKIK